MVEEAIVKVVNPIAAMLIRVPEMSLSLAKVVKSRGNAKKKVVFFTEGRCEVVAMGARKVCLQIVTMTGRVLYKYTAVEGVTAYLCTTAARRAVIFCCLGDRLLSFWGRFLAFWPPFLPLSGCLFRFPRPVGPLSAAI